MASRVLISRKFDVDGYPVTLAAGIKDDRPLVVMGFTTVPFSELQNITIEYAMMTTQATQAFVVKADDEVIRRGIAKYHTEIEAVAQRVNAALLSPYNPHSFTTRGQRKN